MTIWEYIVCFLSLLLFLCKYSLTECLVDIHPSIYCSIYYQFQEDYSVHLPLWKRICAVQLLSEDSPYSYIIFKGDSPISICKQCICRLRFTHQQLQWDKDVNKVCPTHLKSNMIWQISHYTIQYIGCILFNNELQK